MAKIIIGITGKAGAGKSTAAKILRDKMGFSIFQFALPLKRMAIAAGWNAREVFGDQKEERRDPNERFSLRLSHYIGCQMLAALPEAMRDGASLDSLQLWWQRHHPEFTSCRRFMQLLGTEWGREMVAENFWLECWKSEVSAYGAPELICSDDCRFENEFQLIRSLGGIIVRIERDGAGSFTGATHASEAGGGVPDIAIENNGTLDVLEARLGGILNRYFSSEAI